MPLVDVGNQMVWHALKFYLPAGTVLTSVYRPPQAQLDFIVRKAKAHGYTFHKAPTLADVTSWDDALRFVRSKGYKVAPPGKSAHQKGVAYDLSGPDLGKIEEGVRRAVAAGRIRLSIASRTPILREPKNRCVHVEIEGALLDAEPFDWA
jgi:hypothetical protein